MMLLDDLTSSHLMSADLTSQWETKWDTRWETSVEARVGDKVGDTQETQWGDKVGEAVVDNVPRLEPCTYGEGGRSRNTAPASRD